MNVVTALNEQGAMLEILPHLAKQSDDLVREALAFLVAILFGGHEGVQVTQHDNVYRFIQQEHGPSKNSVYGLVPVY